MKIITFLGLSFNSEKDRNAYLFQNKDILITKHNQKKSAWVWGGVVIGIMLAAIFVDTGAWWTFIFLFITPAFLYYLKVVDIKKIEEYAKLHEQFLVKTEKSVRDILDQFQKRYNANDQKIEHISDLINLVNHKMELNLTEKDGVFLLDQYNKEFNLRLFDNEILKSYPNYKGISQRQLAKVLVKLSPEINYQNEENYIPLFNQFCEYLTSKNIEYNIDLKKELVSEYLSLKATRFEQKLNSEEITTEQIEQLDGFEFEQLLGDIFIKAGYKVTVTKKTGDQGADLIVEKDGVSIAVQAKKYVGSVGNKAVQEVVAAMKYYDCDKSMVITTGEFTKGARALADRNKVQLIGKDKIDDLFYIISK